MANAIASWKAAEKQCFQYLLEATQTIVGVTAYTAEDFPRKLTAGQTEMWTFDISGDSAFSPTIQVSPGARPYGCWRFGAEVKGVFESRDTAQELAGMVLTALPAGTADIPSVGVLSWASMPTVEPDMIPKGETGVDTRVWVLTMPLWVAFGNSDYEG
jgi:hypothetical protein